ncbi:MAG TPA: efflux RND transporter permease subunit, partial [Chloroflexota bacterium]
MRITQFSLRNPLVVALLTMALALYGLFTYLNLGVALFPSVSFPGVIVTTVDAGADPATIEAQVTKPIEDAVATLPNIDSVQSISSEGFSTINIQFTTAANPALIPVDVERAVNSVRSKLPVEAEAPSIVRFDLDEIPVMRVALSGPQPLGQLQQIATDQVQRVLEAVPGVGSVQILGGPEREIHVKVNLAALEGRGLGLNTVQQALQSEQVELPAGLLDRGGKEVNVRLNGLVTDPAQLSQIVLARTPGGVVHLGDVATIQDSSKKTSTITEVDGVPAVILVVSKQAHANTLQVSRAIRQTTTQLQSSLPEGAQFSVTYDAATYTQQSFNTIQKTLLEAILFTGLILLLFLHTWRSTAIVLLAIPTSLLTTFVAMRVMGYS